MKLLLLLILALALPARPAAQPPDVIQEGAGRIEGVPVHAWTYPSDGLKVKGLLFLPRSREKLPLVVFNHDGVSGISGEHKRACARLARAGYAVFAPSYRGEDGSQGRIEVAAGEVRDVLNALPLLARVSGINGTRIALMGVSHGALISVLAAARQPGVDAVIAADGVMDIYGWWRHLKQTGQLGTDALTRWVYGDGPRDKPQAFSSRHALALVPKLKAPVLILQSGEDGLVPPEQARRFKAELDKFQVPATLKIYPHCQHGSLVYAPSLTSGAEPAGCTEAEPAWREVLAFLKARLG
jgi:dipeptidyl aminopeptidase/acylaminoacyl peptidase